MEIFSVAFELTLLPCQSPFKSLTIDDSYLLTFCPPGPDDLLNEISQRHLGMVSGPKVVIHCRHARISSSVGPESFDLHLRMILGALLMVDQHGSMRELRNIL